MQKLYCVIWANIYKIWKTQNNIPLRKHISSLKIFGLIEIIQLL